LERGCPRLETELHKRFVRAQVNKVNPRNAFFRISLADIYGNPLQPWASRPVGP